MLAAAHAFEIIDHLDPCPLCLRQREVYWAAAVVALIGAIVWLRKPDTAAARAVDALLGGVFLTGAAVAAFHAGVEFGWWDSPASCAASGIAGFSPEDIFNARPPQTCEDVPWTFAGLSMAAWNVLISGGLAAASLFAALRLTPSALEERHV